MGVMFDDTIETKRACVLKSLCVYLNEDPDKLFKGYMNTDTEVSACKAQTVLGVYAMKREGAEPGDKLEDVGVLIEGEERGDRKWTPCSTSNLYKSFPSLNRVHSSDSALRLPGAGLICSTSSQRNEPNLHVQLLSGPGPAAGSDGQRRLQPGAVAVEGEGDYVDQG
ncbi:unnamed protein product [Arctogadus glacialis]